MKNIAIFCVNYNSYKELDNYIKSIEKSAANCRDVSVDVYVVDNTDKNYQTISYDIKGINIKVLPYHENIGYFGGIGKGMREADLNKYDYVIISNVDVLINDDFFIKLFSARYDDNTGIIAPDIYSITEKKKRNPGRLQRYTRKTLKFWLFMYSHPLIYKFYYEHVYKLRSSQSSEDFGRREIYLAHGSFIILTREYFKRCGIINYPVFLYCEEIYLAEQCLGHNLKTIYDPSVKITDIDHVSTGKLNFKRYCKYNYEAITYILDNFLKD